MIPSVDMRRREREEAKKECVVRERKKEKGYKRATQRDTEREKDACTTCLN